MSFGMYHYWHQLPEKKQVVILEEQLKQTEDKIDVAYAERNQLVSALSKLFPSYWYRDDSFPKWQVVCINLPTGQVTWHIPDHEMLEFFRHLPEKLNDWDGHTKEQKYKRLSELRGQENEEV